MRSRCWILACLAWGLLVLGGAVAAADVANADALYRAGKWQEARADYQAALPELTGDDRARVIGRIGYTFERNHRLDDAIEQYRAVTAMEDVAPLHRSFAQLHLGSCLLAKRQYEQALAELSKLPQIEGAAPSHVAEALLYASTAYVKLDRQDEAIGILARIKDVEGAQGYYTGSAYLRTATMHQQRKQYPEALAAYRSVLDLQGITSKQRAYAKSYIEELQLLVAGDLPFYVRPYVTAVGADSAKLFWVAQGNLPPGQVTLKADAEAIRVKSEVTAIRGTACFHHVAVLRGLAPGTTYSYVVESGGETRDGSFKTNATQGVPVTFAILGDTQTQPHLHKMVAEAIARDKPDFVIHVGDLTDQGNSWGKWRAELFEPASAYMKQSVFWPAIGNHDGGPFVPILFDLRKRFYYSFTNGNVHVAVLDSYWAGAGRSGRPVQLKWLEEDLSKTEATWKVVVLHVPMIATRRDVKWFGEEDFLPLVERLGVDLVLSGHHPMYRKYLPIGSPGGKPVLHVTSGGGGPTFTPLPSPILAKGAGVGHHSLVTVHGNRLELVARQPDGTLIDRFVLIKQDGAYQKEIMDQAVAPDLAKRIRHLYHELLTEHGNNLVVDLDGPVQPGRPVRVMLDTTRLPRGALDLKAIPAGTKLILSQKRGSLWKLARQSQPLGQERLAFEVTPPEDLSIGAGRFKPGLDVVINLEVEGRLFQPHTCGVVLSQRAQQLQAGHGGLPVMWGFRLDPEGRGEREKWYQPAATSDAWQQMSITSWWEDQLNREYDGIGWYRTTVKAPPVPAGNRLWLEFGAVDESCWVYVNGRKVGAQIYDSKVDDDAWRKPRRFDITPHVQPGENLLVVKVRDLFGMGGIYQGAVLRLEPINVLPHGTFDDGPAPWNVSRQAQEGLARPAAEHAAEPTVQLTTDHGLYVEEPSIRLATRSERPLRLTRQYAVPLDKGTYAFSFRFRQQLFNPSGASSRPLAVTLTIGGDEARGQGAKYSVQLEPEGVDARSDWQTVSKTLKISEARERTPLEVEILVREPGVYHFDELALRKAR